VQLTDWGRVYYVNLLSILPAILLGLVFQARTAAVAKPAWHGMAWHWSASAVHSPFSIQDFWMFAAAQQTPRA
jgi:hypothetical protein